MNGADYLMIQGLAKNIGKVFYIHSVTDGTITFTQSIGTNQSGTPDAHFIYKYNDKGIGHYQLVISDSIAEYLKTNVCYQ